MKCDCGAEYPAADIKWHKRINCSIHSKRFQRETDPGKIGEALRKARLSLNMTQGDMADLFGISVSTWSAVENGKHEEDRPNESS